MAAYNFTILDNGSFGGPQILTGINDAGFVVGYYGSNASVSFLFQPTAAFGTYTAFGQSSVASIGAQTELSGINNATSKSIPPTIVGTSFNVSGTAAGAVSLAGNATSGAPVQTIATVGATGGVNPRALAINDAGIAAGYYVSGTVDVAATVGATGRFTEVAVTVPNGTVTSSMLTGIDNLGDVVGMVTLSGGGVEGFADILGTTSLIAVPGATSMTVAGMNNELQVVGSFTDASGHVHGFLDDLTVGGAAAYTTIDAPGSVAGGVAATEIYGINDQGAIVGAYVDTVGITHALLGGLTGGIQTVTAPIGGSTITAIRGSAGVAVAGGNAVTLFDPGLGNLTLIGNAGPDTILALGSGDTVFTGSGNNTIVANVGSNDAVFLGSGSNKASVGLGSFAYTGQGSNTITADGAVVFAGGTVSIASTAVNAAATPTAANTIVGGAGLTVVDTSSSVSGTLLFGGAGTMVANPGTDTTAGSVTMIGGVGANAGTDYFFAGANGGLIFGGSGIDHLTGNDVSTAAAGKLSSYTPATTIVAGTAATTITAYTGAVFVNGTQSDLVLSGNASTMGNLYLVGTGSSGSDQYALGNGGTEQLFEGSGNDLVLFGNGGRAQIVAGSGADTFAAGPTVNSGADSIYNFNPNLDQIDLANYNAASVQAAVSTAFATPDGFIRVTLSGGFSIEFYGLDAVSASFFHTLP